VTHAAAARAALRVVRCTVQLLLEPPVHRLMVSV
jgi:hypothetical protein